jgi:hypothetical protein
LREEQSKCQCQKPQLIRLSCDHMLVVCSFRRLDLSAYVSLYYTLEYFTNTWSDHFQSFRNRRNLPLYHDSLIRSDLTKIHKDRRKVIRISIVMNKIEVVSAVFLVSHKVRGRRRGRERRDEIYIIFITNYYLCHY